MEKKIIKLHEGLVSDTMPETFVDLNDGKGGFVYNYGVKPFTEEVTVEPAEEEEPHTEKVTKYCHNSIVMSAPKTQNNIIETLLTAKYPANREQKLLNDYNASKERVLPSSAKDGYLAFLADKKSIKEMVEADCTKYGIPNTL